MGLRIIGSPSMGRVSGTMGIGDHGHCGRWASRMMGIADDGIAADRAAGNRAMEDGSDDNGCAHDKCR